MLPKDHFANEAAKLEAAEKQRKLQDAQKRTESARIRAEEKAQADAMELIKKKLGADMVRMGADEPDAESDWGSDDEEPSASAKPAAAAPTPQPAQPSPASSSSSSIHQPTDFSKVYEARKAFVQPVVEKKDEEWDGEDTEETERERQIQRERAEVAAEAERLKRIAAAEAANPDAKAQAAARRAGEEQRQRGAARAAADREIREQERARQAEQQRRDDEQSEKELELYRKAQAAQEAEERKEPFQPPHSNAVPNAPPMDDTDYYQAGLALHRRLLAERQAMEEEERIQREWLEEQAAELERDRMAQAARSSAQSASFANAYEAANPGAKADADARRERARLQEEEDELRDAPRRLAEQTAYEERLRHDQASHEERKEPSTSAEQVAESARIFNSVFDNLPPTPPPTDEGSPALQEYVALITNSTPAEEAQAWARLSEEEKKKVGLQLRKEAYDGLQSLYAEGAMSNADLRDRVVEVLSQPIAWLIVPRTTNLVSALIQQLFGTDEKPMPDAQTVTPRWTEERTRQYAQEYIDQVLASHAELKSEKSRSPTRVVDSDAATASPEPLVTPKKTPSKYANVRSDAKTVRLSATRSRRTLQVSQALSRAASRRMAPVRSATSGSGDDAIFLKLNYVWRRFMENLDSWRTSSKQIGIVLEVIERAMNDPNLTTRVQGTAEAMLEFMNDHMDQFIEDGLNNLEHMTGDVQPNIAAIVRTASEVYELALLAENEEAKDAALGVLDWTQWQYATPSASSSSAKPSKLNAMVWLCMAA